MGAYYNEVDPYAAQWLRNLIAAGHIAQGDVDERSIVEVQAADLRGYEQCHFFAGIGGWSLALRGAGWIDDRPVWSGSCPCQSFAASGARGEFDDARHLWPAWFRLIGECRPVALFGEQVSTKDALAWLDVVCADLESADYTVAAFDSCAASVGAPHARQRFYFVAEPRQRGREVERTTRLHVDGERRDDVARRGPIDGFWKRASLVSGRDGKTRAIEPGVVALADGIPARVGRLRAYGNAIVGRTRSNSSQAIST